jgi:hypothetical protein
MAGILSALGRGNQQKDLMRESAALTTVYLLEQNQKFEQYMRQKVDELESRVAAQQARLSTRAETEERELWAALESFEVPPDATRTAEEPGMDDMVIENVPEPEDELMDWDDSPGVEEPLNAGSTAEPEEIPDYLALMSGAVMEPAGPDGIEPEIDPPGADDRLEPDMAEFDEPNLVTSGDEAVPVIEPKDEPEIISEGWPSKDVSIALPEAATELPADNVESEDWPGQPYETFQVNRPEAEAVEEIWPDLALAEEVELLGRQPAADDLTSTEKTSNSHPTSATESDVVDAQAVAEDMTVAQGVTEAEQAWQTPLSDGRKGEWT